MSIELLIHKFLYFSKRWNMPLRHCFGIRNISSEPFFDFSQISLTKPLSTILSKIYLTAVKDT